MVHLFPAGGILHAGKMDVQGAGPFHAQASFQGIQDGRIIPPALDGPQPPAMEVAEIHRRPDPWVHPAQGKHFLQAAQLVDLTHGLRT